MQSNDTYPSSRCPDNGPMPMQQVFVERWLEQQYAPSSTEPYSHDIWWVLPLSFSFHPASLAISGRSWPKKLAGTGLTLVLSA